MEQLKSIQSKSDNNLVSIIVTAQNHQDYLPELNRQLQEIFTGAAFAFEIIYVDDGSSDGTWKKMVELAGQSQNIKLVKLRTMFGESAALDAGMKLAGGELIVYFTCRVNVSPKNLVRFVQKLNEGYDIVLGVRSPRRDSRLNQLVSRVFNCMTSSMTKLKLHDINSGVLATRKSLLEHVPFYGELNAFIPVMAYRQGYKIAEENIEQLPGRFAQSLYPRNYIKRLLDFLNVIFISKYSKKPLHFLGFIGVIFTLLGAVINLYLFIYRILGYGAIAGRPMLLLGAMLFIIGIQLVSIGLLGEMIIYTHANEIEEYNIEEIIE
ncbi:MAG TPA: glycosyltransferase [bacterium]|nr:glycosyltransferase [bacterium]HPN44915.1 glycosyltransferase [bacterium]